ncbi:MAG: Permease of the drug/metabolite transporter (DMT) superfamily [Rhodanobacteraceae bacterium]|jgi:drug/metabolite transporter (DMT)-like permease|nr:MAG: Permease of the drug/metabolite transporter (DMT) superfamily [Rhodanobacteraceae bacterium]
MTPQAKAQWQLHFCVVLWGFTAILGKLITLSALQLVWWRMLIVTVALLLLPKVWRELRAMPPRRFAAYAGIGVVVALHWLTFYSAVKLANASVAATCMALAPVFLAVIEPLAVGRKFDPRELLIGVAVVPGVALVVGGVPADMRLGVAVGALSAALCATFGAFNKRMAERGGALTVTGIELGAGTVFLTLVTLFWHGEGTFAVPGLHDGILLLVLAIVCTLLPFALALAVLRKLSAYTVQLATNLEPVYAIVLAVILLGEQHQLDAWFYAGVAVILGAVFVHPLVTRQPAARPPETVLGTAESRSIE